MNVSVAFLSGFILAVTLIPTCSGSCFRNPTAYQQLVNGEDLTPLKCKCNDTIRTVIQKYCTDKGIKNKGMKAYTKDQDKYIRITDIDKTIYQLGLESGDIVHITTKTL